MAKASSQRASYLHTPAAREDLRIINRLLGLNATDAVHRSLKVLRTLLEAQEAGDKVQLVDSKTGEATRIVFM